MASLLKNNTNTINEILNTINNLPEAGTDLPELTNEGTAADLLSGKELINSEGEKVTGTIATKTSSNLTASGATVTVPAGYYASQATKSVATATQATPSVSIDSAGKITATSTQSAGYVAAGTKTGKKQMTVQAAKTITPTKSSQTAVAKNVYTTGVVTVAAIPSQYEDITTPLADLNAANGGTSATTMAAAVDNTDTLVGDEATLLEQAIAALEGKAAGGSSSIETCTVTLSGLTSSYIPKSYAYTYVTDNGAIESESINDNTEQNVTINNVVCGSCMIMCWTNSADIKDISNATRLRFNSLDPSVVVCLIGANESGAVEIIYGGNSTSGGGG